jgi:hypothetical protein
VPLGESLARQHGNIRRDISARVTILIMAAIDWKKPRITFAIGRGVCKEFIFVAHPTDLVSV